MKQSAFFLVCLLVGCSNSMAEEGGIKADPSPKRTRAPQHEEWKKDGVPYPLGRSPKRCSALALREWVRVRCEQEWAHAGSTKFGPTEGVEIWQSKQEKALFAAFPFRVGDRRVIEFTGTSGVGRYGAVESSDAVISMIWLEGETPVLTID